ncbi:ATP cone domain-containing protein [Candidatus Saccharibacteria bacterium]|nr:ATP cone domain-containing protein [Candidatus Saccharibacteria bacterium]
MGDHSLIQIGASRVLETRESDDGLTIRRRRETVDGKRFTTYERVERPALIVVKQSGGREPFDRAKLMDAITRSVGKFFKSELEIEDVVGQVEAIVYGKNADQIDSQSIGEAVLTVLGRTNEVAYVRFASVFRQFTSLREFEQILEEYKGTKK